MQILVACEESQAVTIALRKLGHEAYSCDLIPCSGGTHVLTVSNAGATKLQLQYEKDGSVYYIEALPDSVSTVVFEK